jgi:hypothetical protein
MVKKEVARETEMMARRKMKQMVMMKEVAGREKIEKEIMLSRDKRHRHQLTA